MNFVIYHSALRPAFELPDKEETGTRSPEKFTAGIIDRMEVANTAVTCVRVKVEISWPKAVVAAT